MLLGFAGIALVGTVVAGAAAADDNPGGGGIGIAVTVAPAASDTSSDASTNTSTAGATDTAGAGFGATSDTTAAAASSSAAASGDTEFGLPVFASGLTSNYVWSANPTLSSAILSITVKNDSKSAFDSSVKFWIDTPVGAQAGKTVVLALANLKPGASRVVQAEIAGLGQWTVMNAHAIVTPPGVIDGQSVKPFRRDTVIVVPPVAAGGISLALVMGFVAFKFVSFSRAAALLKLAA